MPAKKVSVFNSDGSNQRATVIVGQAFRGSDGELYVLDGDETLGSLNVKVVGGTFSPGPLQYTRNGSTATVARDTSTAANNRPLPVQLLVDDASGAIATGIGFSNSSTMRVHVGNASDIPVSIGTPVTSIITNGSGTPYTSTVQSGGKTSLDVAAYQAGTWTFSTETTLSTFSAKFGTQTDSNYGTPSSSTQRVAAMLGVGSAAASTSNPVPVAGTRSNAGTDLASGNNHLTVGGSDGTNLRPLLVSSAGRASVDINSSALPSGAATETTLAGIRTRQDVVDFGASTTAQRVAAVLGNATGALAYDSGASSAQTQRVVFATRHEAAATPVSVRLGNGTSFLDTNFGAPSTTTLRVAAELGIGGAAASSTNPVPVSQGVGSAAVQLVSSTQRPYYQDFSTSNLTTSYTQIIASTGSIINRFCATNNSDTPVWIATGAAASEVVQYIVMPGENAMNVPLQIASGTRIAIRSGTSSSITSGVFSLNVFA